MPSRLLLLLFCVTAGAFVYWRKTPEPATTVLDIPAEEIQEVEEVALITLDEIKEDEPLSPERIEELLAHDQYTTIYNRYMEEWTPPALSPPDSITTKYGAIHIGEITNYDDESITIKTAKGISSFKMEDLRYYNKIEYSAREYADYMTLKMLDHVTTR